MSYSEHTSSEPPAPRVPHHALLRRMDYGRRDEVWFACHADGEFRAVTVIRRSQFQDEKMFELEWRHVVKHHSVFSTHDGWVSLLSCDRNEEQGYFYFVEQLADDAGGNKPGKVDPDSYQPRSLFRDLIAGRRFSMAASLQSALNLAGALAAAHQEGLVCPGLKSSDVLFVNGQPKLAGITRAGNSGRVMERDEYTPPEGWGTPQADVYSLGKIIYEFATGVTAKEFPTWPPAKNPEENTLYLGLQRVVEKTCAQDARKRPANGERLYAELEAVQSGEPLPSPAWGKVVAAAAVLMIIALGGFFFYKKGREGKQVSSAQPVATVIPEPEAKVAAPASESASPSPSVTAPAPAPAPAVATAPQISKPAIPPLFETGRILFSDNFDRDSSGQWTVLRSSEDTDAKFAYDYGVMGIPPAPGAAQRRGLYLAANMAEPRSSEAICVSPIGQRFTGNYRLRFHLWMNTIGPFPAGGRGSTQFALAGVGTEGTILHKAYKRSREDGVWFSASGDGDIKGRLDFTAYRAAFAFPADSADVYAAGTDNTARDGQNPYFAETFPGGQKPPEWQRERYPAYQTGGMAPGALGFAWREVEIIKLDDRVVWMIDRLPFASVTINTPNLDGNIFVGYEDIVDTIAEIPELCFAVIENLVVDEVRPPGSVTE